MRVRIDPDHIPSPVAVQEVDQALYRDEPYMTCSRMAAPLATTEFIAIDQGVLSWLSVRAFAYHSGLYRQLQPSLPSNDDLQPPS